MQRASTMKAEIQDVGAANGEPTLRDEGVAGGAPAPDVSQDADCAPELMTQPGADESLATEQPPLSQQLKAASRKEHKLSDALVAARLVLTATNKRRWAEALACFYFVYAAIERALAECESRIGQADAVLKLLPRVKRTTAFEKDLQTFYGPRWQEKLGQPRPAVQTYLERIEMLKHDKPLLLIAHAYTQHMALLAGGQIMRRSVRGSLQLGPDDPGTAAFELQEPAARLKADYKQALDSLPSKLPESQVSELIEEHRLVFRLNNEIIKSFPVGAWGALSGFIKLLPPEVLLLAVSSLLALILMMYTRKWVVIDPSADDFADPDAIIP